MSSEAVWPGHNGRAPATRNEEEQYHRGGAAPIGPSTELDSGALIEGIYMTGHANSADRPTFRWRTTLHVGTPEGSFERLRVLASANFLWLASRPPKSS